MDIRPRRCSFLPVLVLIGALLAILLAWLPARAMADEGESAATGNGSVELPSQVAATEEGLGNGGSADDELVVASGAAEEAKGDVSSGQGDADSTNETPGVDEESDNGGAEELGGTNAGDAANAGDASPVDDAANAGESNEGMASDASETRTAPSSAAGGKTLPADAGVAAAGTATRVVPSKPANAEAETSLTPAAKEGANGKATAQTASGIAPGATAKVTSGSTAKTSNVATAKASGNAAAKAEVQSDAAGKTASKMAGKTASATASKTVGTTASKTTSKTTSKTVGKATCKTVGTAASKTVGTTASKTTSKTASKTVGKATSKTAADAVLSCRGHAQSFGWLAAVGSGELCGTSGKGKRLEAITLKVSGFPYSGSIKYQTHVQSIGWQKAVADGAMAGTSGRSLRVEALKIWLTGDLAKHYDVVYRGHVQGIGWRSWVKNGGSAGSTGQSRRLEAIEVVLTPKTVEAASGSKTKTGVRAQAHVQGIGWQPWVGEGGQVGTSGQARRVEGMNIVLSPGSGKGGIRYKAHVQGIGWQDWVANGKMMGTSGQSRRVEALCVELTGDIKSKYDVYYSAHVQNCGWTGWARNGERAGSTGCSYRCEAIKVKLVKKGAAAPGSRKNLLFTKPVKKELDGIDISSWQPDIDVPKVDADFVIVKSTEGTWYTNPYFYQHADQVLSSGKLLGSYHFANEGKAVDQADFFVKAVGPYIGKCVLFLDWENTDYSDTMSQGPSWAKQFMDRVYARTGVAPLIYTSANVTRSYDWSSVARDYGLWLAQYPDYEETGYLKTPWVDGYGTGAWSAPTLHQYTSTGLISGYSGHLDLNKFYGTVSDWRKLASKR